MARDWCNCCSSFWAISCLFTSLAAQKVKISKQWKKTPGDIILHKCTKIMIIYMLYCPWDMAHDTCNCYFLFWAIFFPFTPQENKISKKMKKSHGDIIILHVYQKLLDDIWFLRYGGRQVDGWKKWHIELGAPPKNFITSKYQVMIYYKNFITLTLLDIGQKTFSARA